MVGLMAAMISILGYGSSTSYLAALLRRFIPSLFIGAPVAIKAALGDVCDQEGQAKAMAMFTLGFGIGTVLGKPQLIFTSPRISHVFPTLPCINLVLYHLLCSENGTLFQSKKNIVLCASQAEFLRYSAGELDLNPQECFWLGQRWE